MKNPTRLVIVTWGDAWSRSEYYDKDNDFSPVVVVDVGWLCEENDETLVICKSYNENEDLRGLTIIPWCNVISAEEVVFE